MQLVIGAGAVGTATARLLADQSEQVRMVTRSGGGPEHPTIERVAADATDGDALSKLADVPRRSTAVRVRRTRAGRPTGRRSPPACCGRPRAVALCW